MLPEVIGLPWGVIRELIFQCTVKRGNFDQNEENYFSAYISIMAYRSWLIFASL